MFQILKKINRFLNNARVIDSDCANKYKKHALIISFICTLYFRFVFGEKTREKIWSKVEFVFWS